MGGVMDADFTEPQEVLADLARWEQALTRTNKLDKKVVYGRWAMRSRKVLVSSLESHDDLLAACQLVADSALRGSAYDACVAAIAKATGA